LHNSYCRPVLQRQKDLVCIDTYFFIFGNDEQDNERQRLEKEEKERGKFENISIMSSNNATIQTITTVAGIAFIHIFVVKSIRKKKIEQTFKRHTHASCSTSMNSSGDEEKKEEHPQIADL
jgi:hypothetical protein